MEKNLQIFGTRAIIEAIESGKEIDKIFLQKDLKNPLSSQFNSLIKSEGINSSYVPVQKLNRLTPANHQGAIATISPITFHDLDTLVDKTVASGETPLFILLDQVSDVRNFGAIIRTAECTGAHGIIIPKKGGAPVSGATVKTSAGAAFRVPICKVDHLKDAIYYLQGSGITVCAASEKAEGLVYDIDFKVPTAIVMGREDSGVSSGVLKIVDHKAKLPLMGDIASLNVSVACGAFLYEVVRQRS